VFRLQPLWWYCVIRFIWGFGKTSNRLVSGQALSESLKLFAAANYLHRNFDTVMTLDGVRASAEAAKQLLDSE